MNKNDIRQLITAQEKWIFDHGGNLEGYIKTYGSINDPVHSGNGGEAIYQADINELNRLKSLIKPQFSFSHIHGFNFGEPEMGKLKYKSLPGKWVLLNRYEAQLVNALLLWLDNYWQPGVPKNTPEINTTLTILTELGIDPAASWLYRRKK